MIEVRLKMWVSSTKEGKIQEKKNPKRSMQSMKVGKSKNGPSELIALAHANRQKEDI
jgi:hypothetical protein